MAYNGKLEKRRCPQCKQVKEYPVRNDLCSAECRDAKRTADAAARHAQTPAGKIEQADFKKQNEDLRRQLNEALSHQVMDARFQRFVADVVAKPVEVPAWTLPTSSGSKKNVIPTAFLSDPHFDEVIDPAQVNHVNAYNRVIAGERLKSFFEHSVKLGLHYFSGLSYPGICLPLGGDMFSGNIHEELKQTNESTLCDAILYWISPVVAGIKLMAEAYGKVYIPCVVGNHTRMTHRPIAKGRVRDNVDWLYYCLLKRELMDDKRVTFDISEAADVQYKLFMTSFCLTHGDQFKGGSGISGLLSPLMIGDARKRKRSQAINMPYDYLLMGHWHQLTQAKSVIINGSLKGYDEYAFMQNFDYEPPQQAFFLTSAERRQVWGFTPIHVTSKDDPYGGNGKVVSNSPFEGE